MTAHARHIEVEAWPADCLEGECEHVDEWGEPEDMSACPSLQFDTCVDCMVEEGRGDDPGDWDDTPLMPWPHPGSEGWTETPPAEPSIFREPPAARQVCRECSPIGGSKHGACDGSALVDEGHDVLTVDCLCAAANHERSGS